MSLSFGLAVQARLPALSYFTVAGPVRYTLPALSAAIAVGDIGLPALLVSEYWATHSCSGRVLESALAPPEVRQTIRVARLAAHARLKSPRVGGKLVSFAVGH